MEQYTCAFVLGQVRGRAAVGGVWAWHARAGWTSCETMWDRVGLVAALALGGAEVRDLAPGEVGCESDVA